MLLRECRTSENYVIPVCIRITDPVPDSGSISVRLGSSGNCAWCVIFDSLKTGIVKLYRCFTIIQLHFVEVHGISVGICYIRQINGFWPAETIIIINVDFPRFSFFSRYQHYTEWSTGTIDGRGSRILQHRNTFNIIGVQHIHVSFHAVDQNQRRCIGTVTDRTGSTDIHFHVCTNFTTVAIRSIRKIHSRN